ncbi:GNAT family N-acetyltransferase [Legionella brunensis]|uniref:Putative Acetyltransferase, GNAT family n=1 Tax=Legionella brunensis TaxID=29422 RepID=A0A0W0SMP2_9GAMM|nr:GNAT family N-acetyltransferase [Legionella brunensis]KTC84505.1 putative Acetyltransferase, GNAT family [Legionella brunensis]
MLITKDLAFNIENCIRQSHLQFTNQHPLGAVLTIGSGAAFFSGGDSFFSQVVGWGFETNGMAFTSEIEAIEEFYRSKHYQQVDIELCPLVGNAIASRLSNRGYLVSEMNNISMLDLESFKGKLEDSACVVRQVSHNQLRDWAHCVALGFEYPKASEQFYLYAKTKGVTPFGAYVNNELAAGGTIAIHDGLCDLGITSTLPHYRGRGLQKALLYKRLEYAIQSGAKIASVTTEPGSISDLNIQKMGFQIAYTRIKFSFSLKE